MQSAPLPASRFLRLLPCRAALLAVSVALLACGGGKDSPVITQFESAPSIIEVGEKATLKMAFARGEGRLEPNAVTVSSGTDLEVSPTSDTQYTLTVSSGEGVTAAKTSVSVKPGLMLKVEGLPAGVDAAVTVEGPDGFQQSITRTTPLKGLKPGTYTVRAGPVKEGEINRPPLWLSKDLVIGSTGAQVTVSYPAPTLSFKLPGDVALDFVLIPPGRFMMGAVYPSQTADWPGAGSGRGDGVIPNDYAYFALPRHEVTFKKAFYLAKFPTTIRQWKAVKGYIPFEARDKDPDYPMGWVSWYDVRLDFFPSMDKLFAGQAFRFPSEAEWEYALRAGSSTKYFWGDSIADIDKHCWTYETTIAANIRWPKVGLKQPNAWGLHDMFSVYQYMEDRTHFSYEGAPQDGSPWVANPALPYLRTVDRGGMWSVGVTTVPGKSVDERYYFDSAYRTNLENVPEGSNGGYGFRMALSIPE